MDFLSTTFYSVCCTVFIGCMAQLSFNLPKSISSVPITMQTFAINIIPLLFGLKVAVLSSVLYYIAIALGLPVGAGGEGGVSKLYGPTGGYLVGFILASLQVGIMMEQNPRQYNPLVLLIVASIIIFVAGVVWLPFGLAYKTGKKVSNFTNPRDLMMWGVVPFIPGDIIKICLAVAVEAMNSKYEIFSFLH